MDLKRRAGHKMREPALNFPARQVATLLTVSQSYLEKACPLDQTGAKLYCFGQGLTDQGTKSAFMTMFASSPSNLRAGSGAGGHSLSLVALSGLALLGILGGLLLSSP